MGCGTNGKPLIGGLIFVGVTGVAPILLVQFGKVKQFPDPVISFSAFPCVLDDSSKAMLMPGGVGLIGVTGLQEFIEFNPGAHAPRTGAGWG